MTHIIQSLLDTDMYKFTMQQAVLHQFPHAREVEFSFKCRNPGINLVQYMDEINAELDHLCTLEFSEDELAFLASQRYMKSDYIDFLTIFRLQRKYVKVVAINENEIDVQIKGPWVHTIPFEIYVLSIVNEIYFRHRPESREACVIEGNKRLDEKIAFIKSQKDIDDFRFSDFGTRRRYSREWQAHVVSRLKDELPQYFTGTSNVYLAWKFNLTPIGTMAHEYLQACQALGPRIRDSQKYALETWVQEYRGDLGIALTDVVGSDAFLRDFDLYFAKLFDGLRHDSGCPFEWSDKMLNHYKKLRINAKEKSLVYSDGLTFEKSVELYKAYHNQAKLFFGIGTNLTNDCGPKALNIVLKMISCNGTPVAKISDSDGKVMCKNEEYLAYLRQVFTVK